MARNIRRITATTGIAVPPTIRTVDGKLAEEAIAVINSQNRDVAQKINGRLSYGDGAQSSWTGNFDGQFREFTTPSVADTEFTVDHGLNRVPIGYRIVMKDKAADLYASRPLGWNKDSVFFKCDVGSALIKIELF